MERVCIGTPILLIWNIEGYEAKLKFAMLMNPDSSMVKKTVHWYDLHSVRKSAVPRVLKEERVSYNYLGLLPTYVSNILHHYSLHARSPAYVFRARKA